MKKKIKDLVEAAVCITCGGTEDIFGCWCDRCWEELVDKVLLKFQKVEKPEKEVECSR